MKFAALIATIVATTEAIRLNNMSSVGESIVIDGAVTDQPAVLAEAVSAEAALIEGSVSEEPVLLAEAVSAEPALIATIDEPTVFAEAVSAEPAVINV